MVFFLKSLFNLHNFYCNITNQSSLSEYLNIFNNSNKHLFCFNTRHGFCHYKFSTELETAINRQIQVEQQASQDYLSIAMVFLHPSVAYPGAGSFFMRMYEEEIGHMQNFLQYQLLRGGTPVICGLSAPTTPKKLTYLDAFKNALAMEKTVTKLLEDLVVVAESVKDYHCSDFVTSIFLVEQAQSLNEMTHHISKLTNLDKNYHALYNYDQQLLRTYSYSNKNFKIIK